MWINFECKKRQRFIVKPFLGGVNGITGEVTHGDMASLLRRMNRLTPAQDYIVLPEQMWLDGISTKPGIVKQFVATEMAPPHPPGHRSSRYSITTATNKSSKSRRHLLEDEPTLRGASIEWQITGKDSVGGIQLHIIPTFEVSGMYAGSVPNVCRASSDSGGLRLTSYDPSRLSRCREFDVLKNPRDEGLRDGDIFHIKNLNSRMPPRPKTVEDLRDEAPVTLASSELLEIEAGYECIPNCTFKVYLHGQSSPEVALEVSDLRRIHSFSLANDVSSLSSQMTSMLSWTLLEIDLAMSTAYFVQTATRGMFRAHWSPSIPGWPFMTSTVGKGCIISTLHLHQHGNLPGFVTLVLNCVQV
jgi:hypothetical protein